MVDQTEREGTTWYECEGCGMLFDDQRDARTHEERCDDDDPAYIQ